MRRLLAALFLGCASCQLLLGIDPNVNILGTGGGANHDAGDAGGNEGGMPDAGPDAGSMPVALAHATSGTPMDIAVDDKYVFWVTDNGEVGRVDKGGANPQALIKLNLSLAAIALDTTHVYYTSTDGSGGYVYAIGKAGGVNTQLSQNKVMGLAGIAANDTGVYWEMSPANGPSTNVIFRYADGGAAPLYQSLGYLQDISADSKDIFWDENFGTLKQASAETSGMATQLVPCNGQNINAIALYQQNVYYASSGSHTISVTHKTDPGSMMTCIAASNSQLADTMDQVGGIATNGTALFWTVPTKNEVRSLPTNATCVTGPCGTLLASKPNHPTRIAADANAVYWVTTGDKTIWKLNL